MIKKQSNATIQKHLYNEYCYCMNSLKISVVIPFYNTPINLFEQCIKSVKALNPYEIILVDDCSTDNNIINLAKDSNCIYLKTTYQSGHDGIPFNLGVKHATGEYICRVDSDDMLLTLPNKIATDIYFAKSNRVSIPAKFDIENVVLAPRAVCLGIVVKKSVLLKYPLQQESCIFNDVLLVMRLLYNNHTYSRHRTENYFYRKRDNSIQTSKSYFHHRLRHIQTIARFCQLENLAYEESEYYLQLAMLYLHHGEKSIKIHRNNS